MKLIVNPVAANGTVGKRWPRIRDFLRAEGAEFDAVLTERPGHATELARQALAEGHSIIVAVGGDGIHDEFHLASPLTLPQVQKPLGQKASMRPKCLLM